MKEQGPEPTPNRRLICPLCGNTEFQQEEGKIDSKFGVTAHKVRLMICTVCQYVLAFSLGRTIFDFD